MSLPKTKTEKHFINDVQQRISELMDKEKTLKESLQQQQNLLGLPLFFWISLNAKTLNKHVSFFSQTDVQKTDVNKVSEQLRKAAIEGEVQEKLISEKNEELVVKKQELEENNLKIIQIKEEQERVVGEIKNIKRETVLKFQFFFCFFLC